MAGTPSGNWLGGMYTASDGRAEPFTAVPTIAKALQSTGGVIRESCAVRIIETKAGKVSSVVTEHGEIKTAGCFVQLVPGPHFSLSNLGIDLPQLAVKGTVARTAPVDNFFEGAGVFDDICIRRRKMVVTPLRQGSVSTTSVLIVSVTCSNLSHQWAVPAN